MQVLPAKAKDKKKTAEEGIWEDQGVKMGIIL